MERKIKSAYEIAMEKAANLAPMTEEQKGELKWMPEGQKLAARLLKSEVNIQQELKQFDSKALPYVRQGVIQTLLANLSLPRIEADKTRHEKVLEALVKVSTDKKAMDELVGRVKYIFEQYSTFGIQQINKSYADLKQQFTNYLQMEMKKQGQYSAVPDVESLPEFQSQVRLMRSRLEGQYEEHLSNIKEQIKALVLGRTAGPKK